MFKIDFSLASCPKEKGMRMSVKGIYTALSGAMAQSNKLDTIANNIANVNTTAFKRDQQVFSEYLTVKEKPSDTANAIPRDVASIESFYNMQGIDQSFVDMKGTFTDFSNGSLKQTGNSLDVALEGKGFFEVFTPTGVRLARSGSFSMDGNGQLVTKDGFPVLRNAEPGTDISERLIKVSGGSPVSISDGGEVMQDGQAVAKLSVLDVKNVDCLQKIGMGLFAFKPNMNPEVSVLEYPSMKQGFIESSNVNIVQEMTEMIQTNRVFESTQKAIQAYDQMSDKMVNVLGKTTP